MALGAQLALVLLAACLCASGEQSEKCGASTELRAVPSARTARPSLLPRPKAWRDRFHGIQGAAADRFWAEPAPSSELPLLPPPPPCLAAERQASWDYSSLLAPQRFAGIAFDGKMTSLLQNMCC